MYILRLFEVLIMVIVHKLRLYHVGLTIILCGYTVLTITRVITLFTLRTYEMRLDDTEQIRDTLGRFEEPETSDLLYIYDTFTLLQRDTFTVVFIIGLFTFML